MCQALKRLRLSIPEFRQKSVFVKAAGIKHIATVTEAEAGKSLPAADTMAKWVYACGMTMAEFFASLEGIEVGKRGLAVLPEHHQAVVLLIEILTSAPEEARDWIIGNLKAFSKAYSKPKR